MLLRALRRTAPLLALVVGSSAAWAQVPTHDLSGEAEQRPLPYGGAEIQFTWLTHEVGLTDTYTTGNTHTGGSAWVDTDGDGWTDLFITNGSGFAHKLYRNDGDGTFTDVSVEVAKPDLSLEDAGVVFGDLDNDGDNDILVAVDSPSFVLSHLDGTNTPEGGPNLYYENQGDGTFVERAAEVGLVDPRGWRTINVGLADYDRDGWLDVYMGHWQRNNLPVGDVSDDSRLLRNDGTGAFVDVSADCRLDAYGRDDLVSLWFDANRDGWPDLYVGNTGDEGYIPEQDSNDILYLNRVGSLGWFEDGTGDPHVIGDDAKAAMGMDVGDIDRDGDWDLYITDIEQFGAEPFRNPLYLGNPDGTLTDNVALEAGVVSDTSWPCNFADFDRDGWDDLWVGRLALEDGDEIYLNNRDLTFRRAATIPGNQARGGSVSDYDQDGDVDIFVQSWDVESALLRNDTDTGPRRWIGFRLTGTASNRSAIGATVLVTVDGATQMRRVSGGDSAHSQQDLTLHFGVDQWHQVDATIEWPSGAVQVLTDLATNQIHLVEEDGSALDAGPTGR